MNAPAPATPESLPPVSKALGPVTTFHLANTPPDITNFLSCVIQLFTDDKWHVHAREFRDGQFLLAWNVGGGLQLVPVPDLSVEGGKR